MQSNRGTRFRGSPRHPPGLKGRDIGLFYRNLSKSKKQDPEERRTQNKIGPSVALPHRTLNEINKLLQNYENEEDVTKVSTEFEKHFHDLLGKDFHEFVCTKSNDPNNLKLFNNPDFNEKVRLEFEEKKSQEIYRNRANARKSLPATQQQNLILQAINNNQIVLIVGSTGCGKTTQIPQFVLDHFIETGKGSMCQIVCTQPRRISAITVAERVAYERNEKLGKSVGYSIRLQGVFPRPNASILYCTTGTLLRRMESDPLLSNLTHIVLDEIHERSVETDMLMALLKIIIPYRKDMKIILMSATVCQSDFQKYFDDCCTIEIEGTLFDVEDLYLEDVLQETGFRNFENKRKPTRHGRFFRDEANKALEFQSMIEPYARAIRHKYNRHVLDSIRNPSSEEFNLELVENLIFHICEKKPPGAILVFLTGFDKISKINAALQSSKHYRSEKHSIFTLHSSMQTMDQKSVFNRPPHGVRKIILSTNIAETSVTIDDVVYVINCGKIKSTDYDVEMNLEIIEEQWVTLANAQQRRGRAGRVQPGICYNLYTRARERLLVPMPSPEIVRTKLDGVLLNLKLLHINDVTGFMKTLLDCPNEKAIQIGISLLKRINALDESETITPLGIHLARLPVDPQIGKMILMGALFRCVDPITTVAASISYKDPFYLPLGKEKQVDAAKKRLSNDTKSDHLLVVNVINEYRKTKEHNATRNFCFHHFISESVVSQLERMKHQFCELLEAASFTESSNPREQSLNTNSSNLTLLRAVITAGLYPNAAHIKKLRRLKNRVQPIISMSTPTDRSVKFHPMSVNSTESSFDSHYFTYFLKRKSANVCLLDSTMIFPMALIIFGDGVTSGVNEHGSTFVSVADHFFFQIDSATIKVITTLRNLFGLLLQKKALYPSPVDFNSKDEILINAIKILLSHDEAIPFEEVMDNSNVCDDENDDDDDDEF